MFNSYKERVILSSSPTESLTIPTTNVGPLVSSGSHRPNSNSTATQNNGTSETPVSHPSFMEYLDSWQKRARAFDISEALTTGVDKVEDFPENSFAFVVGVGQLLKLAGSEVVETSRELERVIEERGLSDGMLSLSEKLKANLFQFVVPAYEKASNAIGDISRDLFGEELHRSIGVFFDKYVFSIARYAIEQVRQLIGIQVEEDTILNERLESLSSSCNSFFNGIVSSDRGDSKQELINELVSKATDFLSYSKEFFAHNILDKDSAGVNPLTPEILVEADITSRPVYDPLPPAWVTSETKKNEDQIHEYRRAFEGSAPVDIVNGELTNLAKINLLAKSKLV